jgi:ribosomal protein S18 acetylase RimI-like enzyme
LLFKIRPPTPSDRAFVAANWSRGARKFYRSVGVDEYNAGFDDLINATLRTADVSMLCDPDDDDELFGFVVHEGANRLHWIHVKGLFRRMGFAKRALTELFGDRELVSRWPCELGRKVRWNPFTF